MVSDKVFNTDGTQKIFSSDFDIISEDHIRVFLDGVVVSRDDYDLINNAAVFFTAPTTGQILTVQVGTTPGDILTAPTDAGIVAANIADVNTVAGISGDVTTVATNIADINTVILNLAEILLADDNAAAATASAVAAALSETAASASEASVAADAAQTALDVIATNADVLTTAANVVLTNADVSSTNADVAQTALDVIATAADVVTTNANTVLTASDRAQTALDVIATAADVVTTNNNVVLTNADVVSAEAAKVAAELAATNAQASLDAIEASYLGVQASDPTVDRNGDPITIGDWYYNSTTDITRIYDGSVWQNGAVSTADFVNRNGDTMTGDLTAPTFIGNLDGAVASGVKNGGATTLVKGTPVYQTSTAGNNAVVEAADASNAATMPAIGVLAQDLTAGQEVDNGLIHLGFIQGVDTSTFSEGDTIYVASGGGYTNTAPTGEGNSIQNLGKVLKVHASNGSGIVMGAGRSNATPNLDNGKIFIGNASNQAETTLLSSVANLYIHPTTAGNKHIPTGGATDQYLKYDSSGTAVWADVSGGATGGSTDKIFVENDAIVTADYTLARNASSVGPISVNAGVTVTVNAGVNWVIL